MLTYQTGLNFLAFEWKQANLFLRERVNCVKMIWLLKFWRCVNGFVKPLVFCYCCSNTTATMRTMVCEINTSTKKVRWLKRFCSGLNLNSSECNVMV